MYVCLCVCIRELFRAAAPTAAHPTPPASARPVGLRRRNIQKLMCVCVCVVCVCVCVCVSTRVCPPSRLTTRRSAHARFAPPLFTPSKHPNASSRDPSLVTAAPRRRRFTTRLSVRARFAPPFFTPHPLRPVRPHPLPIPPEHHRDRFLEIGR